MSLPWDIQELGAWVVVAIAAVAVMTVILRLVGKVVSASLKTAIILGSLVVIALALLVISTLLNGKLPAL